MAIINEMEKDLVFLDFTGLDGHQMIELLRLIHSPMKSTCVQFPWKEANSDHILTVQKEEIFQKIRSSGLNVYAPSFMFKCDAQNTAIVSEKVFSNKYKNNYLGASSLAVPSTSLSVTQPFVVSASHPPVRLLRRPVSSLQTQTSVQTPIIKPPASSQTVNVPPLTQSVNTPSLKTSIRSQSVNTSLLHTSVSTGLVKATLLQSVKTSPPESTVTSQPIDTPLLHTSLPSKLMKDTPLQVSITGQSVQASSPEISITTQSLKAPFETSVMLPVKTPVAQTMPLLVHTAPIPLSQPSEQLSVKNNIAILPITTSTPHSVESVVDYSSSPHVENHSNVLKFDIVLKCHCARDKQSSKLKFPNLVSEPVVNGTIKKVVNGTIKKQLNPICTCSCFNKRTPLPRSERPFNGHDIPENKPSNINNNFTMETTVCEYSGKNLYSGSVEKSCDLKINLVGTDSAILSSQKVAVPISLIPDPQCEQLMCAQLTKPKLRSFADVLREKENIQDLSLAVKENKCNSLMDSSNSNGAISSIHDDKFAVDIGRYFKDLLLDFSPVTLQPRGLINSGNWCYMNACIQALLACSPFYRLLRNLPVPISVNRGKSSTPILDNMVSLAREFTSMSNINDGFKKGSPFHPEKVYDQIGLWKSDCLKGQQEDAEEFLSYILNGIHGEMVALVKNYNSKNNPDNADIDITNNIAQIKEFDTDDEWQVMGANRRGIITRQVIDNRSILSDLVGGEFKTFLTTNGKTTTSASVQPFFTLQLDIQADSVSSLEEALSQLTVKEPVQGYTCTKTNQEVEAYSKIFIQKLPPILIFHLKRFVYNPNGGCKKLSKCTDFPIFLEIKRDLLSPDVRKARKPSSYRLFAVMYHDGEEAIKGHYLTDVYNHGNRTWIRCDDRNISSINEFQVLSYRPPRVPYLLFYEAMNSLQSNRW